MNFDSNRKHLFKFKFTFLMHIFPLTFQLKNDTFSNSKGIKIYIKLLKHRMIAGKRPVLALQ